MKDQKYTILYIDDEESNLRAFQSTFMWDYHVFLAKSGEEGKKILKEKEVDLIVADQRMPGMTGVEFFREILHDYPEVIRILLTGYSDLEAVISAINEGKIYHYFTKPWDEQELKRAFDAALENSRLKKENASLIQDLKKRNEELNNSYHELDMFLYRAAHDFKGPLARIEGIAKLADLEIKDEQALFYFQMMGQISKEMGTLLEKLLMINLLNLSQIETKKISFREFFQDLLIPFENDLEKNQIRFSTVFTGQEDFVSKPELLKVILKNLIENAIQFSYPNAERESYILLKTSCRNNKLEIQLEDNGLGIPPENLEKIFEMFYRGAKESKGHGLGLYIVKKAVEKLNGKLSVSCELNKYTIFKIEIASNVSNIEVK
ncbi:hybrid sensor histidine kinase/response regulator [Flexithrix dorotheae]|uniref:hybrid sensor histidine kinase/response regulator n=1 Tax=Flexithrix dorotheae TaxID=70993 RepID=UPI00036797E5|nr:hybrid sensor histidine kinase/response regulator [Flexithrix dorotheae]